MRHSLGYYIGRAVWTRMGQSNWMKWVYNRVPLYPPFIEVEVTTRNRCPFNCVMCESSYWDEPDRDMSFGQFKSIIDQFPRLKWIGLTGIGEAFLNKDFKAMIAYCKAKGIDIEIYDLMFFDNTEFLLDVGVDSILVSLDAATEDTYKKIRRGGNWERAIEHTKKLFRLANEKYGNSDWKPKLALHFIVTTINKHEAIQFVHLAHEIAQGYPVAVQFTNILHTKKFPQNKEIEYTFCDAEKRVIDIVAEGLGVSVKWSQTTLDEKPEMKYCVEWAQPFIFSDGTVIPCCAQNLQFDRNAQRRYSLGNVFKTPFRELWDTSFVTLREALRRGECPSVCIDCPLYREP